MSGAKKGTRRDRELRELARKALLQLGPGFVASARIGRMKLDEKEVSAEILFGDSPDPIKKIWMLWDMEEDRKGLEDPGLTEDVVRTTLFDTVSAITSAHFSVVRAAWEDLGEWNRKGIMSGLSMDLRRGSPGLKRDVTTHLAEVVRERSRVALWAGVSHEDLGRAVTNAVNEAVVENVLRQ
jgi:hypothetical protein